MKRSRGEGEAVRQRLVDIASLVISVGEFCQAHDLTEQDVAHLRGTLQPLQRCVASLNRLSFSNHLMGDK
jgi:hypothetical protein